jgi:hypothetical protein
MLVIKSEHQYSNDEASSTMELGCLNLKLKLTCKQQTTRSRPRVKDGEKIQNRS